MDAGRLINMVLRMVLRPLIQRGVNAGIDRVAGKGKSPDQMSDAEQEQAKRAKDTAGKAQKMMRMGRRIGRM